jgi:hypothetical protein
VSPHNFAPGESALTTVYSAKTFRNGPLRDESGQELGQRSRSSSENRAANLEAMRQWAGEEEIDAADSAILQRVQDVLQLAVRNGRGEEVDALLDSFLSWLEFHASRST